MAMARSFPSPRGSKRLTLIHNDDVIGGQFTVAPAEIARNDRTARQKLNAERDAFVQHDNGAVHCAAVVSGQE
jgi:hypothetical protein